MRRISGSDESISFAALHTWLQALARQRRAPRSEHEDCAQDALLALVEEHPDWSLDSQRARAWLKGAVGRRAQALRRQRQRHPSLSLDDLPFPYAEGNGWHRRKAGEGEQAPPAPGVFEEIENALMDLKAVNRLIFLERLLEERDYAEIGGALGLTQTQARTRYNHTLHKLRDQLADTSTHAYVGGGGE